MKISKLSQEIFFKVFLKLSAFSFKSKFSTWLYSFTRNYCINHTRQLKYRKLENRYVDPEELSAYYLNYNYDSSGVDQQQHLRLNYAVSLLSKQEQQLVLMKYCRQITIKDFTFIWHALFHVELHLVFQIVYLCSGGIQHFLRLSMSLVGRFPVPLHRTCIVL